MKNRKLLGIFGITMVLALLLALVPASAVMAAATNTITLSKISARVGETFTIDGQFTPFSADSWLTFYLSSVSLTPALTTYITSSPTYQMLGGRDLLNATANPNGDFDVITCTVPQNMIDGTTDIAVASGTYYIIVTKINPTVGSEYVVYSTAFSVTAPALDPLSPASGPAGTEVSITGSSFNASTALVFKLDGTTVLTPKTGTDTAVRATGIFISTVTIPANTTTGAHAINIYYSTAPTTIIATATFTVSAAPSITLSVTSGAAGTPVTIIGANFLGSQLLTFKWNTDTLARTSGDAATNSGGLFTSVVTVPATATIGTYTITITAGASTATASFSVTSAATTTATTTTSTTTTPTSTTTTPVNTSKILITPDTHAAGATISLIGMGFTPGLEVSFTFDSVLIAKKAADSDGMATISYTIPAGKPGAHVIAASDGFKTATLDFPIEAVAPPIPQPVGPGMNAKVKSPVTFSWAPVIDDSMPVTYNLQISTDANFAAGTIIIDKTKLTTVEYTLTNEELLKLSSAKTNYYWREKSVDAALNESGWSPSVAFTVTQPFKFTGWPLYVTFAVCGVLLFLLGLWLGRRTAFSY